MRRAREFLIGGVCPMAAEYVVMLGLIVVVALMAALALGVSVKGIFQGLADEIGAAAGA